MGKRAAEKRRAKHENSLETQAVIRNIRISPRKLNDVAGLIRGSNVGAALTQLAFSSKRVAQDVRKGLQSAIANAENNHRLDVDSLIVAEAYVGKSLVMKRFRPRARGRAAGIKKSFSNLTIVVRENKESA